MESRTEYIFHQPEKDIVEEVESSLSEEEKKEYGYVQYQDDSSDSYDETTPRSAKSTGRDLDFDIKDIRVEFSRREPPPMLGGTILSNLPYSPRPPSHSPRRNSISSVSTSSDIPYLQPYYEERGELSGHFEPDRLSSDFVAKPPSLMSSRRSSHVTFRNDSSNDSGVSSQATSNRTPVSSYGYHDSHEDFVDMTDDAYEEYMYTLEKYRSGSSRTSSQSTNRGSAKKVRLKSAHQIRSTPEFAHQESDTSLPTYGSTLDSLEDISDNLEDLGLYSSSSDRRSSSASSSTIVPKPPQQGRMMTRKKFHRGYYVRARYPAQLHVDKFAKQKQVYKPPASLCPPSRYGKEAKILKSRPPVKKSRQWPEAPRYPPKARHASTECEIIRVVDTLDMGVQCNADMQDTSVQCTTLMTDSATQYPKIRRKNFCTQTVEKKLCDAGVQNSVEMRSRMVETSQRILYLPMVNQVNAKTQCDPPLLVSCEVQADVEEVMGVGARSRTLTRQDTIEKIKEENSKSAAMDCAEDTRDLNSMKKRASFIKQDNVDGETESQKTVSGNLNNHLVPQDSIDDEKKKAQAEGSWKSSSSIHSKSSPSISSRPSSRTSRQRTASENSYSKDDFHSVDSESDNEGVPESCQ